MTIELDLTGITGTGNTVSARMFGANAIFSQTDGGTPDATLTQVMDTLGVTHVRFGGGQADVAPVASDGTVVLDGVDRINIVTLEDGSLRSALTDFLDWCRAQGGTQATLLIPTKHLSVNDYANFAEDIRTFTDMVMRDYGDVIEAFQIGNEYWEMGETAYGKKASLAAEALAQGMQDAGLAEAEQADILIQMASAGNDGSEFGPAAGGASFGSRNDAANRQIIRQLSDEARNAIDGVTEHYSYNKPDFAFPDHPSTGNFIGRDIPIWEAEFGRDLDLVLTEWHVNTAAHSQQGFVAGSTTLQQFQTMIALGADAAHVWPLDHHSRVALTLDTDEGARLDGAGRLTNSAAGAVFDLLSETLVGAELLNLTVTGTDPTIEFDGYQVGQGYVFYLSSRTLSSETVSVNLSAFVDFGQSATATRIALDTASTNGRQWEHGWRADSIMVDGAAYYYDEHDADVIYEDWLIDDASNITIDLKPFEIVQIEVIPSASMTAARATTAPDFGGLDRAELVDITSLYLSYFNRAPDAEGLAFWAQAYADGMALEAMAAAFMVQPETQALYPAGTSDATFVSTVYINVLGRQPDLSGLTFWAGALENGAATRDGFILEVLRGVEAPASVDASQAFLDQKAADQAYLAFKTEIALYFAVDQGMSDVALAGDVLALFDGTADSAELAFDAINAEVAELVGLGEMGEDGVSLI